MSETDTESNELTIKQLRNILNQDHIRQHLVQTGYIDRQGNVIRKGNNAQLKRPQTSNRQSNPFFNSSPPRNVSSARLRRTSKTKTSARSSRVNQPTRIHNVLLRRAVSPKLLNPDERCLVTMKYIGPDLNIDYDRGYFEPDGDEILLLQQHCGGENSTVIKGFFRPNDTFTFASRRHTDYPFAFAFYLNGVIKDRLSVCCESRCQSYTPVGGKKALIAIVKIENARPCRRCRYEQRITKLLELEKIAPKASFIKKNIERVRSPSKSPSRQTDKPKVPPHHSRSPSPSPPPPPIPRRSPTNSKPNFSHKRTQELSSEGSSPEPPTVTRKSPTNNKTSFSHQRAEEVSSDEPTTVTRKSPTNNKTSFSHQRAEEVSSDESPSVTLPKNSSPSLTVINGKQSGSTFNYTKPSNQNLDSDDERTPSPKQTNRFSSVNNNTNGSNSPPSIINNENKPKNQNQRSSNPPHISTEDESEGDVVSVSDESPAPENKRFSHHPTTSHHRNSFSD